MDTFNFGVTPEEGGPDGPSEQVPTRVPLPGCRAGPRQWKDCEDRVRSLMVVGCGLVTTGVTPGKTGVLALLRLVRSWLLAPARPEELA